MLLAGVAGCGIRGTSVPVDAGPAPSRVSCQVPQDPTPVPDSNTTVPAAVHLVCGAQLVPVQRVIPYTDGRTEEERLLTARALLGELRSRPSATETEAGFSTEVPGGLQVFPPHDGDPGRTLRLSRVPGELPALALAQLVCTFAGTVVTGGEGSVVLAGPGRDRPERFACTEEIRSRPEEAPADGVPAED
ncbi:hypothetical protein HCK00_08710 [Streptomyces sp. PLAI1-29]|uniref:Lipoprotein n=1 Tax=Streptomyces zingiberis TaxID=2053010 RepID=A0ABX1BWF8_9ACTN|nr:hypothetical protein [Streptomyces zingiberis]